MIRPRSYQVISRLGELIGQGRDAGIAESIGTVGDALDNALRESTIGLDKTELIAA